MRPICVVIPDEFREHRYQVLLVEHDHVIQAFSTECPNNTFGNRIHVRLQLPAVAAMGNDFG